MKKYLYTIILFFITISPVKALAAFCPGPGEDLDSITKVINKGTCIIVDSLVPLIFGIALVLFIWGVTEYVIGSNKGKEKSKTIGKQLLIWGVVGLFVMVSVWGLVGILSGTFGFSTGVPQLKIDNPQ